MDGGAEPQPVRLRAVLFDLDGTLIDSIPMMVLSMRHAFEGRRRAPTDAEWISLIGTPLEGMIRRWAEDEADVARLRERYRLHQHALHDSMVKAFDGVPELLSELASRGVAMAVVTSKFIASAERSLAHVGISRFFQAVVGLESTERHKPFPDPVRFALAAVGEPPEASAFVGDSPHDVNAGNAAGVLTVAGLWGPFDRPTLEKAGPSAYAASPAGVLPALDALARR